MPEIVEDVQNEVESNWKPALAYGLATGLGQSTLGPLGYGAGAVAAGSYVGGERGNAITVIGGGEAIRQLLSGGGMSGGNASSGSSRGTL